VHYQLYRMKSYILIFSFVLLLFSCSTRPGKPRILVFSKTSGYHHESIPDGIAAIQKLGQENNFDVDTTTNPARFTEDSLKQYSAVVFLSTTGDLLDQYQEADFERYIQAGGGYVGIHAAADGEYDWGWYGRMVGGYFLDHPGINDTFPNVQPGILHVKDNGHKATKTLPEEWKRTDEWYSFKKANPEVNILLDIDENSYKGGADTGDHPVSWYHEYDGGRAFYTALGHTRDTYKEPLYLQHLLGGIQYAIGDNRELNYSKATTLRVPEEDRFEKTMLVTGEFYEPVELTVLPNLDVLIAQRRGEILLYKNGDSTVKQVGFLKAYFKANTPGVNAEEGVLGIKADPDFANNHFVFVFYSPADTSVNRLSRFKFENDKFDVEHEEVILEFYAQREICCHTGGSIAFDKDGLLYVSTGDNSNPFNEANQKYVSHGYAPLDKRPGHEQWDARRTSGNANDLRGKILRIKVNNDGSYSIPDDNLYPEGTDGTRPEIYVQGNRNPYRISVDQKNGFLYWGEVGPDANTDSLSHRGPRGYDEVNQAKEAGFFGWPLFVGNNYPYHEYDYETGKSGPAFDAAKPVNNSPNNTGIKELPPAQPAFIWYPYAASPDFPQVKTGGRNAMAGPVYYTDMFPEETRLPEYFNKKLFIYDWVRGWVKVVTMQKNGSFDKMEPFLEHTKMNALIDMELGPDGKLYFLEYGNGWFSKNKDSGLSRIDYNSGNLAPKISAFNVDKTSGVLPFKIKATVKAKDPENKKLLYRWNFGNGIQKETSEQEIDYTYEKPGEFAFTVEVVDNENGKAKSAPVTIYAGNEMPFVSISVLGNQSFYFANKPVRYAVKVVDNDDPAASKNTTGLFVAADYFESMDKVTASLGHQSASDVMIGQSLTQSLDCKTCHKQDEKSIGPSYVQVATKYQSADNALDHLVNKIIAGGNGVWGETNMPAHPDLKQSEARQIVSWILSLAKPAGKKSLPANGTVSPDKNATVNGVLVISASYTDRGATNIKPLTATSEVSLQSSQMNFNGSRDRKGFRSAYDNGVRMLVTPKGTGSFRLDSLDLTDVTQITLGSSWSKTLQNDYAFEIRVDGVDGKKIGQGTLKKPSKESGESAVAMKIEPVKDGKFHNVYVVSQSGTKDETGTLLLKTIRFQ
jgi:cytochrome c